MSIENCKGGALQVPLLLRLPSFECQKYHLTGMCACSLDAHGDALAFRRNWGSSWSAYRSKSMGSFACANDAQDFTGALGHSVLVLPAEDFALAPGTQIAGDEFPKR